MARSTPRRKDARAAKRAGPAPSVSTPLVAAVALVCAFSVALTVTFLIYDPDIWQHLAVGRAIWELREIPRTHLWTWPNWGQPEVLVSWGFRALLWPFWAAGEAWGLAAWRWLTTLGAFALVWAAARRMGARGVLSFVVIAVCALTYRQRSMVRPETLVAVLLALELWILETRRSGGPDRAWALPLVMAAWANVHISYYLGLVLLAAYGLDALLGRTREPRATAGPLVRWGLLAGLAGLANPWGWRTLAQPFEYFFVWRHEPIFSTIGELAPVDWAVHRFTGLPLLVAAWPLLLLWRWRRHGPDWAGMLTCALFTWSGLTSQRFLGAYVLVAAAFLSRDLDALFRDSWSGVVPRAPRVRAGLAAVACLLLPAAEWTNPAMPFGIGFQWRFYPVRAVDWMEANDVRGRMFNSFGISGYLLWRGWPERERLPFMDIHQTGSRRTRYVYAYSFQDTAAWGELDRTWGFDHVVIPAPESPEWPFADWLDADPRWALTWYDDGALVYVRRTGRHAAVAAAHAYRQLPGGQGTLGALQQRVLADTAARAGLRAELDRALAASPWNSRAHSMHANLALLEDRLPDARAHLVRSLAINPLTPAAHRRLGLIALAEGRPEEAVRELRREIEKVGWQPGLALEIGGAYRRLGRPGDARRWFELERRRHPERAAAAAESLRTLGLGP